MHDALKTHVEANSDVLGQCVNADKGLGKHYPPASCL